MPAMVFFGCLFIALGPSLALFLFTIAKFPLRIILLIVGAFFWLLALLFSSLLWLAATPAQEELSFSLVFSVVFQELARFALFKLMSKAEVGMGKAFSEKEKQSIAGHRLSYVSGFGFGLMSGLFSLVNVLSNAIRPGNTGITKSSGSFFMISSFLASCMILLHTLWNVILFNAFKNMQLRIIAIIVCFHMLVSCLTLINATSEISFVSVIVLYLMLVFSSSWAYIVVGTKTNKCH